MADIELVINIPKYVYNTIIACDGHISDCDNEKVGNAIKNGILLPKGHGRLIDESKIKKCGWNFIDHHAKTDAPSIIEADKEQEE